MVGIANYDSNKIPKSLSITPFNDIKDILNFLEKTDQYGLENTYEDIANQNYMNDIFDSYVDSLNKSQEEIELLIIYYSGLVVKGKVIEAGVTRFDTIAIGY